MNRTVFFAGVRNALFRSRLTQAQVDGMNALLNAWEADFADHPTTWLAYCLATAYHETAHTMQPVTERGRRSYFNRYQGRSDLGNDRPGDGYRYRGRGHVQLTGRYNYERAGDILGVPLAEKPDLALDPDTSARVLFEGCIEGWFTGRKLAHYLKPNRTDYANARRIVNAMDRASLIAGYARDFEAAIRLAQQAATVPDDPGTPDPQPEKPRTWWQRLARFTSSLFRR